MELDVSQDLEYQRVPAKQVHTRRGILAKNLLMLKLIGALRTVERKNHKSGARAFECLWVFSLAYLIQLLREQMRKA